MKIEILKMSFPNFQIAGDFFFGMENEFVADSEIHHDEFQLFFFPNCAITIENLFFLLFSSTFVIFFHL